jgi:transposase
MYSVEMLLSVLWYNWCDVIHEVVSMPLMTISEAARHLDTSEETIISWVNRGLLRTYILPETVTSGRTCGSSQPLLHFVSLPYGVDQEELEEVAETEGWLLVAASSLEDECD